MSVHRPLGRVFRRACSCARARALATVIFLDTMSTPTSTSSRKRKADALESADDGESSPSSGRTPKVAATTATPSAHLPASCLAAILDFMEYAEVRRCLLAGKILAVDAARHVETLNIMNASELVPSAARRFANVAEINILSLLTENDDGDILSADTATRSVPFLIAFPKLKRAYLGGFFRDTGEEEWFKYPYRYSSCREPEDHLSVFRGLVDHLCGAFRSRSLSPSLYLNGVFEVGQLNCYEDKKSNNEGREECRRCWNTATSFPPELVLETKRKNCLCLCFSKRIQAFVTRHDNPLPLHPQAAIKCFLVTTRAMLKIGHVRSGRGVYKDHFVERIKSQGGWHTRGGVVLFHYIPVKDMEALKKLAACIGPSAVNSIPRHELLSALSPLHVDEATDDGKKRVLVRQTFEGLVQLGFDLASKDFVLIDPLNEIALREYHFRFRSEEKDDS